MSLQKIVVSSAILLLFVSVTPAQQIPRVTLKVLSEVPIEGLQPNIFAVPNKCDASGNLYIRPANNGGPGKTIIKVGTDGKVKATYVTDTIMADYSVSSTDGEVAIITLDGRVRNLVRFSPDGLVKGKIELPFSRELNANRIIHAGPLMFFSGQRGTLDNPEPALFTVSYSGGEISYIDTQESFHDQNMYAGTRLASDEAGNLFVMRPTNPALVIKLNPSGEILRRYQIAAPQTDAIPLTLQASHGRIAVGFVVARQAPNGTHSTMPNSAVNRVIDQENGEILIDYTLAEGRLADCYVGPSAFTGLDNFGAADQRMHIVRFGE